LDHCHDYGHPHHHSHCPILKEGSSGPEVQKLQELLIAHGYHPGRIDGIFGPKTLAAVLSFQANNHLVQDGIVGTNTWTALGVHCDAPPVNHCPTLYEWNTGPAVVNLQEILKRKGFYTGQIDGVFGPITKGAVLSFQASMGLVQDGIVGIKTWTALGVHCY
jgi:peptidoglycan hydrolase-like protein with peptidoglycan-binding domain